MKSYAVVLLLLVFAGCKSSEGPAVVNPATTATASPAAPGNPAPATTNSAPAVKAKVDVCNLLTSNDLKQVQGEAYKEAQRSDRQDGDFVVAQCYYLLPTTVNSVVVNVTARQGGRNPRDLWEETFRKADEADREGKTEREREKEKTKSKAKDARGEEEEEEEGLPPERVKGLGDEAFWSASRIGGALYVLKN